jgi:Fe-S-cluster containining protein
MDTASTSCFNLPAGLPDGALGDYFVRLRRIFADMDRQYSQAAAHYGFQCSGCEDTCCLTHFYHHTYLEFLFIREGFSGLDAADRRRIRDKAEAVCSRMAQAHNNDTVVRVMCPLNDAGMCGLYAFRPMICRLHGIPHELQKPGRPVVYGPGCAAFDDCCSGRPYFKFDRTPFYYAMAGLENEFKQAAGLTGAIKLTVAEMIIRI